MCFQMLFKSKFRKFLVSNQQTDNLLQLKVSFFYTGVFVSVVMSKKERKVFLQQGYLSVVAGRWLVSTR